MAEAAVDGEVGPTRDSATRFFGGQLRPRIFRIVFHWTMYWSVGVTGVVYLSALCTTFGEVPIDSIRTNLTAYAALSFGASVSGALLVLTLPAREFVQILSSHRLRHSERSSYSDLMFVFTWSAFTQLATIVVVLGMYAFGGTHSTMPEGARATHHVLFVAAAFVIVYSLFRLVVVVSTLSQVARVIERRATGGGNP